MAKVPTTKGVTAKFTQQAPGGSPAPSKAMSQPKSPGGGGFLIDHNAFTDARPPGSRGQRKSAGYPSFNKNP